MLSDADFMACLAARTFRLCTFRLCVSVQATPITSLAFTSICQLQGLTSLVLGTVMWCSAGTIEAVTPEISRLTSLKVTPAGPSNQHIPICVASCVLGARG